MTFHGPGNGDGVGGEGASISDMGDVGNVAGGDPVMGLTGGSVVDNKSDVVSQEAILGKLVSGVNTLSGSGTWVETTVSFCFSFSSSLSISCFFPFSALRVFTYGSTPLIS